MACYYPPEVRRGKNCELGVILLQYFPLVKIWNYYSWVVKIPQSKYSDHNTSLGHHTDYSPMGLSQYNRSIV